MAAASSGNDPQKTVAKTGGSQTSSNQSGKVHEPFVIETSDAPAQDQKADPSTAKKTNAKTQTPEPKKNAPEKPIPTSDSPSPTTKTEISAEKKSPAKPTAQTTPKPEPNPEPTAQKTEVKKTPPTAPSADSAPKTPPQAAPKKDSLPLPEKASATVPTPPTDHAETDSLLEEDISSFWMIQQFLWQVLKVGVLLGGIGFLSWLIWKPQPSEPVENPWEEIATAPEVTLPQPEFSAENSIPAPVEPSSTEPVPTNPQISTQPKLIPAVTTPRSAAMVAVNSSLVQEVSQWLQEARWVGLELWPAYQQSADLEQQVQLAARLFVTSEKLWQASSPLEAKLQQEIVRYTDAYRQKQGRYQQLKPYFWEAVKNGPASLVDSLMAAQEQLLSEMGTLQVRIETFESLRSNVIELTGELEKLQLPAKVQNNTRLEQRALQPNTWPQARGE